MRTLDTILDRLDCIRALIQSKIITQEEIDAVATPPQVAAQGMPAAMDYAIREACIASSVPVYEAQVQVTGPESNYSYWLPIRLWRSGPTYPVAFSKEEAMNQVYDYADRMWAHDAQRRGLFVSRVRVMVARPQAKK